MKLTLNGELCDIPAVWYEHDEVVMIDQPLLPTEVRLHRASTVDAVCDAIESMVVRGAPTIGATAAYGMALAQRTGAPLDAAADALRTTRPTAHDLFHAIMYMQERLGAGDDAVGAAEAYASSIIEQCRRIGEVGAELIGRGDRILTHCNAGALATLEYGTALAPIRVAFTQEKDPFVFVDETRPRLQGARLTAWELAEASIRHAVIPDNAAGYYLWRGEIDIVITGADRVVRNGDAANKIGTYEKAVVAAENDVPFYIAIPEGTFDPQIASGVDIPIEERDEDEVRRCGGRQITPEQSPVRNPAFDIIPAAYITGYITSIGIIAPEEMATRFGVQETE